MCITYIHVSVHNIYLATFIHLMIVCLIFTKLLLHSNSVCGLLHLLSVQEEHMLSGMVNVCYRECDLPFLLLTIDRVVKHFTGLI